MRVYPIDLDEIYLQGGVRVPAFLHGPPLAQATGNLPQRLFVCSIFHFTPNSQFPDSTFHFHAQFSISLPQATLSRPRAHRSEVLAHITDWLPTLLGLAGGLLKNFCFCVFWSISILTHIFIRKKYCFQPHRQFQLMAMTFGRLSLKVPFTLLSRNHSRDYFSFFSYSGNHSHNSIFSLFSSSNHSRRSFSFLFFFRKSLSRFLPSFIQEAMLKVLFPFFFYFFIGFFLLFSSGNHSQIIVQEHFLRALLLSTILTWTTRARRFRWILGSENGRQSKYVFWVTAHFAFGLQMICSSCFLVWR